MTSLSKVRILACAAGAAALAACGGEHEGPLKSDWTAKGANVCRMVSAGWGAPIEAADALIEDPHKPVEVGLVGGAPVFLFVQHCGEGEQVTNFAELYVHSEPEGELPADYRLKRPSGQYLAFLAGDPGSPPLSIFAPHGVKVVKADVTWRAVVDDAGETVTAKIAFPRGSVTIEELFHADEAGDDFATIYDAVSAGKGRLIHIAGPEKLARRKARRTIVTVEGATPLDGLGLPAENYMGALGERDSRELTIKSAPAK